MTRPLYVVGPQWCADDLGGTHVSPLLAVDVARDGSPGDWWCSGQVHAELRAISGAVPHFSTPGGMRPVAELPHELRLRRVETLTAGDVVSRFLERLGFTGRIWVKPNDLKLPGLFPAFTADGPVAAADFVSDLLAGHPRLAELPVAVSEPLPARIAEEYRIIAIDGSVASLACYRNGSHSGRGCPGTQRGAGLAYTTATEALSAWASAQTMLPRSFIVDVAILADRRAAVLETNPAAASGWYEWHPGAAVARSISLGQHDDPVLDWTDPLRFLTSYAAR